MAAGGKILIVLGFWIEKVIQRKVALRQMANSNDQHLIVADRKHGPMCRSSTNAKVQVTDFKWKIAAFARHGTTLRIRG